MDLWTAKTIAPSWDWFKKKHSWADEIKSFFPSGMKNSISQATEKILRFVFFLTSKQNEPSSPIGRQRKRVRKPLSSRPAQRAVRETHHLLEWPRRMTTERADRCWCQCGALLVPGWNKCVGSWKKDPGRWLPVPIIFKSFLKCANHWCYCLPLCFQEVIIGRLAIWSMPSCLCCAGEISLALNVAFPKQNAGAREYVFSPLKSWMGKI